jgi:hypothetical protein
VRDENGKLVGIDVDALHPERLLGIGLAKALLHLPEPLHGVLFEEMRRASTLDLEEAMPFVRLAFAASWTKLLYLKGRARLVDPDLLDPERFARSG